MIKLRAILSILCAKQFAVLSKNNINCGIQVQFNADEDNDITKLGKLYRKYLSLNRLPKTIGEETP